MLSDCCNDTLEKYYEPEMSINNLTSFASYLTSFASSTLSDDFSAHRIPCICILCLIAYAIFQFTDLGHYNNIVLSILFGTLWTCWVIKVHL